MVKQAQPNTLGPLLKKFNGRTVRRRNPADTALVKEQMLSNGYGLQVRRTSANNITTRYLLKDDQVFAAFCPGRYFVACDRALAAWAQQQTPTPRQGTIPPRNVGGFDYEVSATITQRVTAKNPDAAQNAILGTLRRVFPHHKSVSASAKQITVVHLANPSGQPTTFLDWLKCPEWVTVNGTARRLIYAPKKTAQAWVDAWAAHKYQPTHDELSALVKHNWSQLAGVTSATIHNAIKAAIVEDIRGQL